MISLSFYTFPTQLGKYVNAPHKSFQWFTDPLGLTLHETINAGNYVVYILQLGQTSQSGKIFIKLHTVQGSSPLKYYASVTNTNDSTVCLHSWTRSWTPEPMTTSFWDVIESYKNPGLWGNLRCNGDGSWIYEGLCMGSLAIIHDRSYMKELSPDICLVAVMIYCTFTGLLCKCTIAKKSTSAESYQGKILGAILAQLILHAVV
jgi:hypothetical protein